MRWAAWAARGCVTLAVSAAGVVAWMKGGGADARLSPPRPTVPATAATKDAGTEVATGAEVYEVKARLVESLGDASIDVPNLAASQPLFQTYWRKLRGPWARPPGTAGQLVTSLALHTNPQAEIQWAVATQAGGLGWTPNVRVWNMNEGSFDQREAIYAPTPATLRFRLAVPAGAKLRFSPAVVLPVQATTVFEVTVIDSTGGEHRLAEKRIAPANERRWHDVEADLGPWGEQKVDLLFRTWSERLPDAPKHGAAANATEGAAPDGGVTERGPPLALALWGDPVIVAKEAPRAAYNVLWIVVDALRPDVAASLHDAAEDAKKLSALRPPLDALLPVVPGLMPSVDRLAARGVHFTHAWSAASWTRPGTLAMLTGERSSEVGIDTTNWVQPLDRAVRYYASDPPLVPRLMRKNGFSTAAFVNNFFMAGYAVVGLDMGFERITDHRYRTRDTALITYDALSWLGTHAKDRFFLFVNLNSPHEPYDPPKEMLERIPPPPAGPRDGQVRAYMAEAAKDDVAIGVLLDRLESLGLTRSTLVVFTADHGETLSAAHDGYGSIGQDKIPQRFHHAVGNFEETTRIPIVMALPGLVDGGRAVEARVRNIDIAPTILDIEGLEADARMSGRSLLPLIERHVEAEPRPVVSEGRMSRALLWGKWRLIAHDPSARPAPSPDGGVSTPPEDELFDLEEDPGERHSVARLHPEVMAEMRSRLAATLSEGRTVEPPPAVTGAALPVVHLRFAGRGKVHQVTGALTIGDAKHGAAVTIDPQGIPAGAIRVSSPRVDFEFPTSADGLVGFDIRVDPPAAPIVWQLFLDSAPWPDGATFVGPYGLPAVAAKAGIFTEDARLEVFAPALPVVDPGRDLGVFVTRDKVDRSGDATQSGPAAGGEGAKEMQRVLEEWGYAHGSH